MLPDSCNYLQLQWKKLLFQKSFSSNAKKKEIILVKRLPVVHQIFWALLLKNLIKWYNEEIPFYFGRGAFVCAYKPVKAPGSPPDCCTVWQREELFPYLFSVHPHPSECFSDSIITKRKFIFPFKIFSCVTLFFFLTNLRKFAIHYHWNNKNWKWKKNENFIDTIVCCRFGPWDTSVRISTGTYNFR